MTEWQKTTGVTGDAGLRVRMRSEERRISAQHERLDRLCQELRNRIDRVGAIQSMDDFMLFKSALEAHMSVEDDIYFPALHGLRPEAGPELEVLIDEHEQMRREVEGIRELLVADDRERGSLALGELTGRIARHEVAEEELIARVSGPPLSAGRLRPGD